MWDNCLQDSSMENDYTTDMEIYINSGINIVTGTQLHIEDFIFNKFEATNNGAVITFTLIIELNMY